MKKSSKKGFTLMEVMVTVGLLSLVGVLCSSLIFIGIRHSRQNSERSAFQIGVNKFVAVLNERINSAGNGKVDVKVIDNQVEITANSKKETYKFNSDTQQIILSSGGQEIIIAPYVKNVGFEYNTDGKRLLKVRVQSDFDEGWLETSFYIR